MQNNNLAQLEIPTVMGQQFDRLPDDLFIPPNALEICLETFSGPMDLLLYLIKKENFNSGYLIFDCAAPSTTISGA